MDFIYGCVSFLIIAVVIAIIVGLIKPSLFAKFLRSFATRGKITLLGLASLFVLGWAANITEPASLKQERQTKQVSQTTAPQPAAQQPKIEQKPNIETKTITEKKIIGFETENRDDSSLEKGTLKRIREGADGERTLTYKVTITDGKETKRELVKEEITTAPLNRIVANGTYVKPAPVATSSPMPVPSNSSSVYYANCTAARNAGAAPVYRDQPGYGSHLDRDNDGIGCE